MKFSATPCVRIFVRAPQEVVVAAMEWALREKPPILGLRGSSSGPSAAHPPLFFWSATFHPDEAERVVGWLRDHGVEQVEEMG